MVTQEVGLRRRDPASPLYPKLRFACTDHPITGWAGAILLRLYFELIGLRAALVPLLVPFAKTSNNQSPAVDVFLAWWDGLALGAERLEQLTAIGAIRCCPGCWGCRGFPSPIRYGGASGGSPIATRPTCRRP
ncbi:MAG: hypothetical protein IPM58_00430 [Nitrospira sp.]|nr:hypothetical protein [Nitrospira sp.]